MRFFESGFRDKNKEFLFVVKSSLPSSHCSLYWLYSPLAPMNIYSVFFVKPFYGFRALFRESFHLTNSLTLCCPFWSFNHPQTLHNKTLSVTSNDICIYLHFPSHPDHVVCTVAHHLLYIQQYVHSALLSCTPTPHSYPELLCCTLKGSVSQDF